VYAALAGVAPELLAGLSAMGKPLAADLRGAFRYLYRNLCDILTQTKSAGTQMCFSSFRVCFPFKIMYQQYSRLHTSITGSALLQAVLHAFSLCYTEDQFQLVVSLGIFPALNRLLLSDGNDAAASVLTAAYTTVMPWELRLIT